MIETDQFPFILAKYYRKGRTKKVRLVVLHSTESLEVHQGARNVAKYFQDPPRVGSSHLVCDDREIIQCVHDSDTAAGAVGANQDGIHIEQVGRADQTPLEWQDPYSQAVIENAANATAQYCLKYEIPVVHLTVEQIQAGEKGIVGHGDISKAYPGTGHTDPGAGYCWPQFLAAVKDYKEKRELQHAAKPFDGIVGGAEGATE